MLSYIVLLDNPLSKIAPDPDIVVDYDHNREEFLVAFTEGNLSGYIVENGELVSEAYKYRCEIIDGLLQDVPDEEANIEDIPRVLIKNQASNAINLIQEGNRRLF